MIKRKHHIDEVVIDGVRYVATIIHHANCNKCDLNIDCPFPLHCEGMIGHKVFKRNGEKKKQTAPEDVQNNG